MGCTRSAVRRVAQSGQDVKRIDAETDGAHVQVVCGHRAEELLAFRGIDLARRILSVPALSVSQQAAPVTECVRVELFTHMLYAIVSDVHEEVGIAAA